MHGRCANLSQPNYGGRGISVCEEWSSFEAFAADMGPTSDASLELDRVDSDGNYSLANCRWASRKDQQRNKRANHVVVFAGRSLTIQGWSEILGLNANTIVWRLRRGWPVKRALSTGADTSQLPGLFFDDGEDGARSGIAA